MLFEGLFGVIMEGRRRMNVVRILVFEWRRNGVKKGDKALMKREEKVG